MKPARGWRARVASLLLPLCACGRIAEEGPRDAASETSTDVDAPAVDAASDAAPRVPEVAWATDVGPLGIGLPDLVVEPTTGDFFLFSTPESTWKLGEEVSCGPTAALLARLDGLGRLKWSRCLPDERSAKPALAVDRRGRVVVGTTMREPRFSGKVRVFDGDGAEVWSQSFSRPDADIVVRAVAVGPTGPVVALERGDSKVLVSSVVWLDEDGATTHTLELGSESLHGLFVDAKSNVYVSGSAGEGTRDYGDGPKLYPPGLMLLALGPTGALRFVRRLYGTDSTWRLAGQGDTVWIQGYTGYLELPSGAKHKSEGLEGIVVAFDAKTGLDRWFATWPEPNHLFGLAAAGGGRVVVTGSSSTRVYLQLYEADGRLVLDPWSPTLVSSPPVHQGGCGVAVTPSSEVILVGGYAGTLGFGKTTFASGKFAHAFLARLRL